MNKLTKREQQEKILVTVGRLRIAVKYSIKNRQLLLLEKIAQDIELMEQAQFYMEQELRANYVKKYDIFTVMKYGQ